MLMRKLLKKRNKKLGMPPGSLVYIGDNPTSEPQLTIVSFDETHCSITHPKSLEECTLYKNLPGTTWINVDGLGKTELITQLGSCLGLHPLVMEDILNTDQRPKVEDFGDYLYVVVKMLSYDPGKNEIISEQISFVLGKNFVISFQEGEQNDFIPILDRINNNVGYSRKMSADYLLYSMLDVVVDHYFLLLEKLGEEIDDIQDNMINRPGSESIAVFHKFKREMISLRKALWPLREVIGFLEREISPLVTPATQVYLRDLYDHTIQVIDTVENIRDTLSGMLDIYMSTINYKMNEIMKVLTIIATIFIPLSFITGVYGMNFVYMPELHWKWGYPAVWGLMIAVTAGMLAYFKKKKWL